MTQKTLKDESKEFIPKVTLNITDLDRVDLNWPMEDGTGVDKDGVDFTYKVIKVNGLEYRVPGPVLSDIKNMLELKPDLEFIKVTKTGSGKGTRYAVKMVQ